MKNQDLLAIAQEFGSPVYVYDAAKIEKQYKRLTSAFDKVESLRINYAVKALSNISVLKLMVKMGAGLDTVSIQEVMLGMEAGAKPANIIYTPNGISLEEIEKAAKLGVQIDRKSTRLNSSNVKISYAVFCLKKKKHIHYHSKEYIILPFSIVELT